MLSTIISFYEWGNCSDSLNNTFQMAKSSFKVKLLPVFYLPYFIALINRFLFFYIGVFKWVDLFSQWYFVLSQSSGVSTAKKAKISDATNPNTHLSQFVSIYNLMSFRALTTIGDYFTCLFVYLFSFCLSH